MEALNVQGWDVALCLLKAQVEADNQGHSKMLRPPTAKAVPLKPERPVTAPVSSLSQAASAEAAPSPAEAGPGPGSKPQQQQQRPSTVHGSRPTTRLSQTAPAEDPNRAGAGSASPLASRMCWNTEDLRSSPWMEAGQSESETAAANAKEYRQWASKRAASSTILQGLVSEFKSKSCGVLLYLDPARKAKSPSPTRSSPSGTAVLSPSKPGSAMSRRVTSSAASTRRPAALSPRGAPRPAWRASEGDAVSLRGSSESVGRALRASDGDAMSAGLCQSTPVWMQSKAQGLVESLSMARRTRYESGGFRGQSAGAMRSSSDEHEAFPPPPLPV